MFYILLVVLGLVNTGFSAATSNGPAAAAGAVRESQKDTIAVESRHLDTFFNLPKEVIAAFKLKPEILDEIVKQNDKYEAVYNEMKLIKEKGLKPRKGWLAKSDNEVLLSTNYAFFQNAVFSQWHRNKPFKYNGIEYPNTESFMMCGKAVIFDPNNKDVFNKILNANGGGEMKKLGRSIKNFNPDIWNENAESIVYLGNWLKFTQNKQAFDIIVDEEFIGKTFVEAAHYDKIWGIGRFCNFRPTFPNYLDITILDNEMYWDGTNYLGKAITKVRDHIYAIYNGELKQKYPNIKQDEVFNFFKQISETPFEMFNKYLTKDQIKDHDRAYNIVGIEEEKSDIKPLFDSESKPPQQEE